MTTIEIILAVLLGLSLSVNVVGFVLFMGIRDGVFYPW